MAEEFDAMKRISVVLGLAFAFFASLQTPIVAQETGCTCRGPGRDFEVGQSACLMTPKGYRLAKCGTVLNNTSWIFSDTPCVSSRRQMTPASHAQVLAALDAPRD
jgi:hypothetical protein